MTNIETLKKQNGDYVLPRTRAKAVSMENGTTVETAIINLNNHTQDTDAHHNMGWLTSKDIAVDSPTPLDADTLEGYNSDHFATKSEIKHINDILKSSLKWEVINEVTTTEEVVSLTINTDLDGNAFDLAEIQVDITFPTYGSANDTLWYLYFAPQILNFTTSSFMSGCKQVFINYNALSNRGILMHSTYSSNTQVVQMNLKAHNITEFRIANWNNYVLPIGTTVRVIGRRTTNESL